MRVLLLRNGPSYFSMSSCPYLNIVNERRVNSSGVYPQTYKGYPCKTTTTFNNFFILHRIQHSLIVLKGHLLHPYCPLLTSQSDPWAPLKKKYDKHSFRYYYLLSNRARSKNKISFVYIFIFYSSQTDCSSNNNINNFTTKQTTQLYVYAPLFH